MDTDRGYIEFLKIAKESGFTKERLEYYTNAYEASGESGLRALSYRKRMPEDIREAALGKINRYLSNRVPPHLTSEIGFLDLLFANFLAPQKSLRHQTKNNRQSAFFV